MPRPARAMNGRIGNVQPAPSAMGFRMMALVAVGAGAFSALNSGAVAWLLFHDSLFVPVWGRAGIMFNALPSSIIPALLMSILGSFATRRHLTRPLWPAPAPGSWIRRLPTGLIARAFILTAGTTLIVVAITYLGVTLTGAKMLSLFATMATQLIQAFIMGVVLGPIVVSRVFCETRFL